MAPRIRQGLAALRRATSDPTAVDAATGAEEDIAKDDQDSSVHADSDDAAPSAVGKTGGAAAAVQWDKVMALLEGARGRGHTEEELRGLSAVAADVLAWRGL